MDDRAQVSGKKLVLAGLVLLVLSIVAAVALGFFTAGAVLNLISGKWIQLGGMYFHVPSILLGILLYWVFLD